MLRGCSEMYAEALRIERQLQLQHFAKVRRSQSESRVQSPSFFREKSGDPIDPAL